MDYYVAAATSALWLAANWLLDLRLPFDVATADGRLTVYQLLGALAAAAIALFVVPLSVVLALAPGDRLAAVLAHHERQVRSAVVSASVTALALLTWTLVAALTDEGEVWKPPVALQGLGIIAVVATGLAVARIVSVLNAILVVREHVPPGERKRVEPVELDL